VRTRKHKVAPFASHTPVLVDDEGDKWLAVLSTRTPRQPKRLELPPHLVFGSAEERRHFRNRHSASERVDQKEPVRVRPRFGRAVLCPVHHARFASLEVSVVRDFETGGILI
jgi:hypothetical protein